MLIHINCKLASLITLLCKVADFLVIAGNTANTKHTGLLIKELINVISSCKLALSHKIRNDSGVDRSASCTHHNALCRSNAHGCIIALTALDCSEGSAVTEVAGYDVALISRLAEHSDSALRNVLVRCTVEAVATHLVLLIVLVRNSVHIRGSGHCLVEGSIKYCYLRNGHDLLALNDTLKVSRVMKRTKVAALLDDCLNLIGYKNRAGELIAAVNNSVTNCADLCSGLNNTHILGNESVKNELKSYCMVRHIGCCLVSILTGNGIFESGLAANLLANTLCDYRLILHIDELELKR